MTAYCTNKTLLRQGMLATYLVKEILDVLLVHPWLDIANPKRLGADLPCLLVGQTVLCHIFF